MREKDLHKIIKNNGARDNTLLANALKNKHPELAVDSNPSEQSPRRNRSVKRLVAVFAPLSAAAVLAAVLIPTVLLSGGDSFVPSVNPPSGSSGAPPNDLAQSPAINNYISKLMHCTVQEYNKANNTSFLYFDAIADDYSLTEFRKSTAGAFLGLGYNLTLAETQERINYVVCADADDLDFLGYYKFVCVNEQTVADRSVKYAAVNNNAYGIFDHDNYGYYIMIENANESRLFELIQDLLNDR